jgi:D-xylose transport system permease protein
MSDNTGDDGTTVTTAKTAPPASREPSMAATDFAGDVGPTSLREAFTNYIGRVRGGDVGMLPALIGLIVLLVIFSNVSSKFLTKTNLANLMTQAAPIALLGIGIVFVLLLGEIDLSAGTASGVAAATMGIAITNSGDLKKYLGGPTFYLLAIFMLVAAALAAWYRIWVAVVFILVGLIILFTHIGNNAVIAILLSICVGVAIGVFTGFLVAKIGIPSFVVTLALFLGWQGVLLQFVGTGASINVGGNPFIFKLESASAAIPPVWGWILWAVGAGGLMAFSLWRSIRNRSHGLVAEPIPLVLAKTGTVLVITGIAVWLLNEDRSLTRFAKQQGIPRIVPLVLVVLVIWTLVLAKTPFGRHLYAVGGNAEAARRAGINVLRIRMSAFIISSGMAGLAGVVAASRTASIDGTSGGGNTLLFAVAAAVIGGTSLFGGKGRVRDALIGGLVIAIIPNGLGLKPSLPASYNLMITAAVLLAAAAADALSRRKARLSGLG